MTAEEACSYFRSAAVYGALPTAAARAKPPRAPARPDAAAQRTQAAVPAQSKPLHAANRAKARPASASLSRTNASSNTSGRPATAGADRPQLYYKPIASIGHDADVMASVLAYIAAIPTAVNSRSPETLQYAPEPTPEPIAAAPAQQHTARCSLDAMSCIAEEERSLAATASHSNSRSAAAAAAAATIACLHSSAAAGAVKAAITPLALDAFTAYRPSLDDSTAAALDVRGGSVVAAIAAARRTEGEALQRRRRRSAAATAAAVAAAGSTTSRSSTSSSSARAEQFADASAFEQVSTYTVYLFALQLRHRSH
jgi:hypothetical protein